MVDLPHLRASSWLVLSLVLGSCAGAAWRCPLAPVATGAQLLNTTTITHDGIPRSWYTYVPASIAAAQAAVPLVIDLHGVYDCASAQLTYTGWLVKAEEFGLIVAWPQAEDEPIGENGFTAGARWNAGTCDECLCENCVYKGQGNFCCRVDANATDVPNNNADDVGFLREVVAQVAAAHPVDTTRVYVTGHSSGCLMAQRVLAQASDLVAAVACFSGALALANDLGVFPLTELSSEYTPRPLMVIHGNADSTIPYAPVPAADFPGPYFTLGAEGNLALWGGYNGCPGDSATETPNDNYTLHDIDCNGIVSALVEVPGVGHYPIYSPDGVIEGLSHYDGLGTAPFDTAQLAWDFLKAASIILLPDILSAAFNSCPVGCVSANARQRGKLSFGSFCPESPDSCVST